MAGHRGVVVVVAVMGVVMSVMTLTRVDRYLESFFFFVFATY